MIDRQMMGMSIEMKMSLGNILTILTVVVGITLSYAVIREGVDRTKIDVTKLETRIERLETQNGDVRDRMTRMEVTLQNMAINIDRVARYVDSTQAPRGNPQK
ncbi:hypothetical protein V9K92_10310 [Phyllobacterium sp. CCNWLW109]|uniref:hypothetical protein n=1 Tax=Phyllobacterium sp. CCNWLW109 TaxID=3127479 RepID=UPI0030772C5B